MLPTSASPSQNTPEPQRINPSILHESTPARVAIVATALMIAAIAALAISSAAGAAFVSAPITPIIAAATIGALAVITLVAISRITSHKKEVKKEKTKDRNLQDNLLSRELVIADQRAIKNALIQKIKVHEQKMKAAEQELQRVREEVKTLQSQIERLETEKRDQEESTIEPLRLDANEKSKMIRELGAQKARLGEQVQYLEAQKNEQEEFINRQTTAIESKNEEAQVRNVRIRELENELTHLRNQHFEDLKKNKDEASSELNGFKASRNEEIQAMNAKIQELENNLREEHAEAQRLEAQKNEQEEFINRLTTAIESKNEEAQARNVKIRELENELTYLRNQHLEAQRNDQAEIQARSARMQELENELTNLRSQHLEAQRNDQAEIQARGARIEDLERELRAQQVEVKQFAEHAVTKKDREVSLEASEKSKREIAKLLYRENTDLKAEIQARNARIEKLERDLRIPQAVQADEFNLSLGTEPVEILVPSSPHNYSSPVVSSPKRSDSGVLEEVDLSDSSHEPASSFMQKNLEKFRRVIKGNDDSKNPLKAPLLPKN